MANGRQRYVRGMWRKEISVWSFRFSFVLPIVVRLFGAGLPLSPSKANRSNKVHRGLKGEGLGNGV